MQFLRCALLAFFIAVPFQSAQGAESQAVSMSFEDCLSTIRKVASDLATAPINIVETDIARIVRFVTVDGSVLITCSKPDHKMVVTKSD